MIDRPRQTGFNVEIPTRTGCQTASESRHAVSARLINLAGTLRHVASAPRFWLYGRCTCAAVLRCCERKYRRGFLRRWRCVLVESGHGHGHNQATPWQSRRHGLFLHLITPHCTSFSCTAKDVRLPYLHAVAHPHQALNTSIYTHHRPLRGCLSGCR